MATRGQKIQVGLFVSIGLLLMILVFVVISVKRREPTDTFFIKFHESVSGLGKDSDVLYLGVPVGKVEDVHVTKDNEIIVKVGIFVNSIKLRKGTIATLGIANLMGGSVIELSGGKPSAPELHRDSFIPYKPSILENIAQDLPKILEDISNILGKIDRTMGDVTSDRLGSLVRNADNATREISIFLHAATDSIQNTEYEITQTIRSLRDAIAEANRTLASFRENPSSVLWGRPRPKHPYVR